MKSQHTRRWDRKIAPKLAAALLVAAVCDGCFAPRNPAPLATSARPGDTVAILPVQAGDIRITIAGVASEGAGVIRDYTTDQISAARTANTVLNSLAHGGGNPLIGPSKVAARLDAAEWERLMVYLNDRGPLAEAWKREGLRELAGKLRAAPCVQAKLLIVYESRPFYPRTPEWAGTVTVQLEQLDLVQGRRLALGRGEAGFWGSIGAIGGPQAAIPYAVGTTFGRAVDQAARKAFSDLFHPTETGQLSK